MTPLTLRRQLCAGVVGLVVGSVACRALAQNQGSLGAATGPFDPTVAIVSFGQGPPPNGEYLRLFLEHVHRDPGQGVNQPEWAPVPAHVRGQIRAQVQTLRNHAPGLHARIRNEWSPNHKLKSVHHRPSLNALVVDFTDAESVEVLRELLASQHGPFAGTVAQVHRNYLYTTTAQETPVGVTAIYADSTSNATGDGITVGIIDTGLMRHPDLHQSAGFTIVDCLSDPCNPSPPAQFSSVYDPGSRNAGHGFVETTLNPTANTPLRFRLTKLSTGTDWTLEVDGTAATPNPQTGAAYTYTAGGANVKFTIHSDPDGIRPFATGDDFWFCVGCGNDDNGHGTHMAGIIAAADNADGIRGVAPEATLIGIKAFDEWGTASTADLLRAIEWASSRVRNVVPPNAAPSSTLYFLRTKPGATNGDYSVTLQSVAGGTHTWGLTAPGGTTTFTGDTFTSPNLAFDIVPQPGKPFTPNDFFTFRLEDPRVRVGNLSWGSGIASADGRELLHQVLREGKENGVIWVASAGAARQHAMYNCPGAWKDCVLTVAAGSWIESDHGWPHFDDWLIDTNYSEPRTSASGDKAIVLVAAPGEAVISTWNDDDYFPQSGSSVAAAHVSGVVALYLDTLTAHSGAPPSLTSYDFAAIENELRNGAGGVTRVMDPAPSNVGNGTVRLGKVDLKALEATWTAQFQVTATGQREWRVTRVDRNGNATTFSPHVSEDPATPGVWTFPPSGTAANITFTISEGSVPFAAATATRPADDFEFRVKDCEHLFMRNLHIVSAADY